MDINTPETPTVEPVSPRILIGPTFKTKVHRASREQVVVMIETYVSMYPGTPYEDFVVPTPEALKGLDVLDYVVDFAELVQRLGGSAEAGFLAEHKMAATIFAQLYMRSLDFGYLGLDDYASLVAMTHEVEWNKRWHQIAKD